MGHATYSQLKLEEIPEATPLIEDDDEDEDDWRRALLAFRVVLRLRSVV
jgi:hypothetical protein